MSISGAPLLVRSPEARLARVRRLGTGSRQLDCGLVLFGLVLVALAIQAWSITPADLSGRLVARLKPPGTPGAPLGTDQLGRSLLARVLAGLPWSLSIGATATAIAAVLGVLVGLMGAWFHGLARSAVLLAISTVVSFPALVMALVMIAVVGRGFWPIALTMGLIIWPVIARVVYAEARGLLQRDYVLAARLFGVRAPAILAGHVLPGLRPTIMVMVAFVFAIMLVFESALSFLGLGAPLNVPSWGNMLADSRNYLANAPWMMAVPAGVICLTVIALNLIGDGLSELARRRARAIEG